MASSSSSPTPLPPPTLLLLRLGSFISLVAFQTTLALVYKAAQGADGRYRFNAGTLMLVAEAVKLLMSLSFFVRDEGKRRERGAAGLHSPTPEAEAADDIAAAAAAASESEPLATHPPPSYASSYLRQAFVSNPRLVPTSAALSLLYALNNQLTFLLLRNDWADSANFNLIKGGAAIVSTLMLYALGRAFSGVQWAAVLLQVCGLVIAQFGATCTNTPVLHPVTYLVLALSLVVTSICSVVNEKVRRKTNVGDSKRPTSTRQQFPPNSPTVRPLSSSTHATDSQGAARGCLLSRNQQPPVHFWPPFQPRLRPSPERRREWGWYSLRRRRGVVGWLGRAHHICGPLHQRHDRYRRLGRLQVQRRDHEDICRR
jgi:hypothetical protein